MAPTRFPYGISYVKPGENSANYSLVAGDVTPDVSMGTLFYTANSAVTISRFDGGELGKTIYIYNAQTNSAVTFSTGGGIILSPILSANTATGATTYGQAGTLAMLSNQLVGFMFIGNSSCVQVNG